MRKRAGTTRSRPWISAAMAIHMPLSARVRTDEEIFRPTGRRTAAIAVPRQRAASAVTGVSLSPVEVQEIRTGADGAISGHAQLRQLGEAGSLDDLEFGLAAPRLGTSDHRLSCSTITGQESAPREHQFDLVGADRDRAPGLPISAVGIAAAVGKVDHGGDAHLRDAFAHQAHPRGKQQLRVDANRSMASRTAYAHCGPMRRRPLACHPRRVRSDPGAGKGDTGVEGVMAMAGSEVDGSIRRSISRAGRTAGTGRALASSAVPRLCLCEHPRMLHIILYQPEIPPNTGNVIRLAANTGASLHLIEPLGFKLDDARLRRAGLDYHEYARLRGLARSRCLPGCAGATALLRIDHARPDDALCDALPGWRCAAVRLRDAWSAGRSTREFPTRTAAAAAHETGLAQLESVERCSCGRIGSLAPTRICRQRRPI